jgi:hypothetical protein
MLRQRIGGGDPGLRDPHPIVQGWNVLFSAFGGKVPLCRAQVNLGAGPISSRGLA